MQSHFCDLLITQLTEWYEKSSRQSATLYPPDWLHRETGRGALYGEASTTTQPCVANAHPIARNYVLFRADL